MRGEPVDRPPVNFYEIGGRKLDPDDPDPFNVHNDPSWRPLIELAEDHTDIIRMARPVVQWSNPDLRGEYYHTEEWIEGDRRLHCTTLHAGGRTLRNRLRRDADMNTVWTTDHLLRDADDLRAYLDLPDELFVASPDVSHLPAMDEELGDRGIVALDTHDPICEAASLFSMENYTIIAMTEEDLFRQLLEKIQRALLPYVEEMSREAPGRLWRVVGSEYASEPYLPPSLYEAYVVEYTGPVLRAIQRNGGYARLHSHGRLKNILPFMARMAPDALDPIEPPPQGDVELIDVRREYGSDWVLMGNIEATDLENLPPEAFEAKVRRALEEGTTGEGRGFILLPSACPYGRTITPRTLENYRTMVRLAKTWPG